MYLGFSSTDLDQNQITDYLTRVVQPKLSAISGVQRAGHPRRPHLRHADLAQAGPDGGARHLAVRGATRRWRGTTTCRRSDETKGSMVSVNLVANTDLRTPEEFRQLVVKEQHGVVVRLGDIADVVLGAENYDQDVRFNGETATFMGIWVLPTANSLDVIAQGARGAPGDPGAAAGRHEGRHPLRLDRVHPGRDQRSAEHAHRDAADRRRRHLPVPRLVPLGAHPGRRHPDFA